MEQRQLATDLVEELRLEDLGEEVMVAVPLPVVIEWHDEEVLAVEGCQHLSAAGRTANGVAEWPAQPLEGKPRWTTATGKGRASPARRV